MRQKIFEPSDAVCFLCRQGNSANRLDEIVFPTGTRYQPKTLSICDISKNHLVKLPFPSGEGFQHYWLRKYATYRIKFGRVCILTGARFRAKTLNTHATPESPSGVRLPSSYRQNFEHFSSPKHKAFTTLNIPLHPREHNVL